VAGGEDDTPGRHIIGGEKPGISTQTATSAGMRWQPAIADIMVNSLVVKIEDGLLCTATITGRKNSARLSNKTVFNARRRAHPPCNAISMNVTWRDEPSTRQRRP